MNLFSAQKSPAARMVKNVGRIESMTLDSLEERRLLVTDPIAPDHPLWVISRGSAVVDGNLSDASWQEARRQGFAIDRTQATRLDSALSVMFLYDDTGLYIGFNATDQQLWADGTGGGAGNRWEVETDDSITFYFDPDNSRDLIFQDSDRAFGVNIASPSAPINGSGAVRRYKYVKGTGTVSGIPDVNPGGAFATGMVYATLVSGSVNDNTNTDVGWSVEMFMPWASLNMAGLPTHGSTIGINFDAIFDNDGSGRNLTDNRNGPNRFTLPHFVDDHVQGAHSSYSNTLAGVRGPVNYAEAMFVDPRAGLAPAAITGMVAVDVTSFGGRLSFNAPAGTSTNLGHVWKYEIRYAASAITNDAQWASATVFANAFTPRLRGLSESIRMSRLAPGTTYHISVRAIDAAGNLGPIGTGVSFTTAAAPSGTGRNPHGRLIVSPFGNHLSFEDGTSFVPIGDHLGMTWRHTRRLFTGDIWDNANSQYNDFSVADLNGPYEPYFDMLEAHGINTMRVYLELQHVYTTGNTQLPRGTNWIENNVGQYNPDMRNFVLNILRECGTRGIHVIFSPYDSFSYDDAFQVEGPWGSNFNGPLTGVPGDPNGDAASDIGIDRFFQTSQTLQIAMNRMTQVIAWVNESPYKDYLIGYEPLSEWDSYEWTLNIEGNTDELGITTPGREREMRNRAIWMNTIAGHIRGSDPAHLVLNSTIVRDPRGPLARQTLYARTFDALTPHLYVNSSAEPINNPATDTSILPAAETAMFSTYWLTHRLDRRPILNGEWGMTRAKWPGGVVQYSAAFTQLEDEALYRTTIWAGFAAGLAGTGLRIVTEELAPQGYLLTDAMRDSQLQFSTFINSTSLPFDYANFAARSLSGNISATGMTESLLAFGSTDGRLGYGYVLNDNGAPEPTVNVAVRGLVADQMIDIEVWSTAAGQSTPVQTLSVYSADGTIQFAVFVVSTDFAFKFKGRPVTTTTQIVGSVASGTSIVTFTIGPDQQPVASVFNTTNDTTSIQNVAAISRFYGRLRDLQAFIGADGVVNLAGTDTNHQLWVFAGNVATASWTATNLSQVALNGRAVAGDLTFFQGIVNVTGAGGATVATPGADNIVGLNNNGNVVRFRRLPGATTWDYYDQTAAINGVKLVGSLCAYVSSYNGQNIAGLTSTGEVVTYWWASARGANTPSNWANQNMTLDFAGPLLTGQLDAYVTSWNGLNIAGVDAFGNVVTYWWAPRLTPDPNRWRVTNIRLSVPGGGPKVNPGVEVTTSVDRGINIFGQGQDGNLKLFRWLPGQGGVWNATDVTVASGGPIPAFGSGSAGASSANNRMLIASRAGDGTHRLALYVYRINTATWFSPTSGITVDRS